MQARDLKPVVFFGTVNATRSRVRVSEKQRGVVSAGFASIKLIISGGSGSPVKRTLYV